MRTLTKTDKLILKVIEIHVWASGPVSASSILSYVRRQATGDGFKMWQLVPYLICLLKAETITLYEDGISFDVGTVKPLWYIK